MRKFLIIVMFWFFGTCIHAQDYSSWDDDAPDLSWMDNQPGKYLPMMTQLIISADSPCNTDGEAFKDFIPRFRKDKAFRDSRVLISNEMQKNMFTFLADSPLGYGIFKALQKNTRCDKSYGTWYNVTADEVCFSYNDVLPCNEEAGGGSVSARFQRIDGKWYITGVMAAG